MRRLKTILGYAAGALALLVVLATFLGNDYLSSRLVSLTGMKVSPWYTGGEIRTAVRHDNYMTLIHRPVFDGLISEREEGFIQVNWESTGSLPRVVEETVDYNGDNRPDFLISLNTVTGDTLLTGYNPAVGPVLKTYKLGKGWAVRIKLRNIP